MLPQINKGNSAFEVGFGKNPNKSSVSPTNYMRVSNQAERKSDRSECQHPSQLSNLEALTKSKSNKFDKTKSVGFTNPEMTGQNIPDALKSSYQLY